MDKKNLIYFLRNLKIFLVDSFFWLLFAITLGFAIYFYKSSNLMSHLNDILTPLSIFAVFLTYKENVTQQRKEQVTQMIDNILDNVQKNKKVLNDKVNFHNLTKKPQTIPVSTIHKWICKENENGMKIDNDKLCEMTEEGKEIRAAIINILNEYEKLAIAVFYKAVDEKIAFDSLGFLVWKNYKIFRDYIEHQRKDHGYKDVWEYLEWLYKKWKKKNKF